jgi:hypothetical protein
MKCPLCGNIIKKVSRTTNQNKYLWGVVYPLISGHTGYSNEEVHEIMKRICNPQIVNIKGEEYVVGKSTASLTTAEFNAYISRIVQFASFELGVIIPEPEVGNETSKMAN